MVGPIDDPALKRDPNHLFERHVRPLGIADIGRRLRYVVPAGLHVGDDAHPSMLGPRCSALSTAMSADRCQGLCFPSGAGNGTGQRNKVPALVMPVKSATEMNSPASSAANVGDTK